MKPIPPPGVSTIAAFTTCISTVADAAEKAEYTSILPEVDLAAQAFQQAVQNLSLHQLPVAQPVAAAVSDSRLKAIYTNRMVRKRGAGRPIYDNLLASAPGGICPLCSVGHASTLDHYAPKSVHPMLSVVPVNLVPACSDCNHGKLAVLPRSATEHTLHPYFDNVDSVTWLTATVQHSVPAAFQFGVAAPVGWSAVLRARVQHHFLSFDLGPKFAVSSANELTGIRYGLEALFRRGGAVAVQAHLSEQAASRAAAARNTWQTAMYVAMASDGWFVGGGFR